MDVKGEVLLQLFNKSKLRNGYKTYIEPKLFGTFCGQGERVFFRCGRPQVFVQKTSDFLKFIVRPHGQGGRWGLVSADILRTRRSGQFFAIFCGMTSKSIKGEQIQKIRFYTDPTEEIFMKIVDKLRSSG